MNVAMIRKCHRWVGIIFSPFLIIIAITGFILLLEETKVVSFSEDLEKIVFKVHTWEYIGTFMGLVFPIVLMFISISGLWMFISIEINKRKNKCIQKSQRG